MFRENPSLINTSMLLNCTSVEFNPGNMLSENGTFMDLKNIKNRIQVYVVMFVKND